MKILQVAEPGMDGVFRHVEGLIDFLLARGHEISFAYSDCRGSSGLVDLVRRVEGAGGRTLNLKVSNAPQIGDTRAAFALSNMISELNPEILHAHSSKAGVLVRALAAMRSSRVFYTPNAYYGMGGMRGGKVRFFNLVERLAGRVGHTIHVSGDEADFGRKHLGLLSEQQSVIPNAVDAQKFYPANAEVKQQARARLGLPLEAVLLGSLGRLSDQKDPVTLYQTFHRIAKDHPRLHLVHVGSGPLEPVIHQLRQELGLSHRITRIDHLKNPSVFYQALDGFVLNSRYEGLAFAVLEAMASGLPLILTDVPGNREFQGMGLSHLWTCPAGRVEGLAEALSSWISDLESGRVNNHRSIAEVKFSFEACYSQIESLYFRALSKG